jgi:hypothetical protein
MSGKPWGSVDMDLAPWEVELRPKVTTAEAEALRDVVESADDERPIQAHLVANPRLFVPLLGGRHGRWVRPQVRFGDRYVADFMIADADSVGIHWRFVELESPRVPMFIRNGELAEKARRGIHQIQQWRDHVDRNAAECRRLRSEGGLGLPQIRPRSWGLVLLGHSEAPVVDPAQTRRRLEEDDRVMLRSYDWLLDRIMAVAEQPLLDHRPGGLIPYGDSDLDARLGLPSDT